MRICDSLLVFFFLDLATCSAITKRASPGGGANKGGTGPSNNGGGGEDEDLYHDPADCDFYASFSNIFYTGTWSNRVLLDDDDAVTWEFQNITGVTNITSANPERDPTSEGDVRNINWLMDIYDAYYNGTLTMTLEPDANNATTASCASFSSQPIPDTYLRIGPQSRNGSDRSIYDSNDFYFAMGRSFVQDECPITPNKLFFAIESSSSLTSYGQTWNLSAAKNSAGDGFDVQGSVQSRKAAYNNHYHYVVNVTDPGYVQTSGNGSCPTYFDAQALTSLYTPTISGTITAEQGKITWSFLDYFYGYRATAVFEGQAWEKGPKLDTSGNAIATTGEAKRVVWKSKEPSTAERFKWVIVGCTIGGVIILGWLVYKCRCCCSSKKKPAKEPYTYIQQGQTWQR